MKKIKINEYIQDTFYFIKRNNVAENVQRWNNALPKPYVFVREYFYNIK
jgi:hypothetical protein